MNVILFDIDGTLLSSGGAGRAALAEALASAFAVEGVIDRVTLSGRTDRAILADLLAQAGIADREDNRQRLLAAYLRHLPGCLARCPGCVLPGVMELLDCLRRRGDVVGLLTGNVRAGARLKLGHYGLADHFPFGGFGDLHLDRDDVAREALVALREHARGEPRSVWVIGDTPHDVRCARAIGARAVAVATGWHGREELAATVPDLLLDDLRECGHLLLG